MLRNCKIMHFLITNDIIRNTYNDNEILRKNNKKGDIYEIYRICIYEKAKQLGL